MSDVMLLGVLRMPIEFNPAPLSQMAQFVSRAREAADRIEELQRQLDAKQAEIDGLMAENFSLAAGQCCEEGGLLGDECGNIYCDMKRKVKELEALNEARRRMSEARVPILDLAKLPPWPEVSGKAE